MHSASLARRLATRCARPAQLSHATAAAAGASAAASAAAAAATCCVVPPVVCVRPPTRLVLGTTQLGRGTPTLTRRWLTQVADAPAPSTAAAAAAKAAAAPPQQDSSPPYPFASHVEYGAFLDLLELRLGHRFAQPSLVLALMFHSSRHRHLAFLGSGLLRFYASHSLHEQFTHYDEGYLTRIKDFLHHGLHIQDLTLSRTIGFDLTPAVAAIEAAQARWHARHGEPTAPPPVADDDGAPMSAAAARAEFDRLLRSTSSSSDAFVPFTAFPSDMFPAALAALYLDGGWLAADRLANRTVRPQLLRLQELLAHEMPDPGLASQNYKALLQSLVQRLYGVTPTFHMTLHDRTRRTVRVVIPPIQNTPRQAALFPQPTKDPENGINGNESALAQLHAIHVARTAPIEFRAFTGLKRIAEQRAARAAYEQILQDQRDGALHAAIFQDQLSDETATIAANDPDADRANADSTPMRIEELRSILHKIAAQLSQPEASIDTNLINHLQARMDQLVHLLISPAALAFAQPHAESSSASMDRPSLSFSQWTFDDYALLLTTLHTVQAWKAFPLVWPLLTEIDLPLSPATTHLLLDAFAHARTLPLVIQTIRRVRTQNRFTITPAMYHQLLLASTDANQHLGWQHTEKVLAELIDMEKQQHKQATATSSHQQPSLAIYNAALWSCLAAWAAHNEQLAAGVPNIVSAACLLKQTDRIRAQMSGRGFVVSSAGAAFNTSHARPAHEYTEVDLVTIGLCAILDAYAYRPDNAWRYVLELEHRVAQSAPPVSASPARLAWRARLIEAEKWTPLIDRCPWQLNPTSRYEASVRKQAAQYAVAAQPVIDAVLVLLKRHYDAKTPAASDEGISAVYARLAAFAATTPETTRRLATRLARQSPEPRK